MAGFPAQIFIKIDTGYHRAGVDTEASLFQDIVDTIFSKYEPSGDGVLGGFYSHSGHSYGGDSEEAAIELLTQEIELSAAAATKAIRNRDLAGNVVLSVGATPTASSVQNIFNKALQSTGNPGLLEQLRKLENTISEVSRHYTIELHAGVYTLLDLQQLATRALPYKDLSDLGLSVLTEVASV